MKNKKSLSKEQLLYYLRNEKFRTEHPKVAVMINVVTAILLLAAFIMLLACFALRIIEKVQVFSTYSNDDWRNFAAIVAVLLTVAFIAGFFFKKEKQGKADFSYFGKLITLSSGIMAVLFWIYVILDTVL